MSQIVNKKNMFLNKNTGLAFGFIGLFILFMTLIRIDYFYNVQFLVVSLVLMFVGIVVYAVSLYANEIPGIKNNEVWFKSLSGKGFSGYLLGVVLTTFYVVIYWYPELLGMGKNKSNTGLIGFFDPLSYFLNGHAASQWFVYGTLYTLSILGFGIKFILKYRNNAYQVIRTCSVMFFQLAFAFLIPELLSKLNPELPYFAKDIKNMWPLNYYFFEDWHLKGMLDGGNLGLFMLVFGVLMVLVISPILTYYFGKRWYCSWVCGCGGLAETAGDSFRQLSDKTVKAWKIERYSIHIVLVFVFITTVAVIHSFFVNNPNYFNPNLFLVFIIMFLAVFNFIIFKFFRQKLEKDAKKGLVIVSVAITLLLSVNMVIGNNNIFFINYGSLKQWYGFFIGAMFSGVVGVGFYPLLGSRVWCRFGCPMAAVLGLQQKLFSRFRITTNGSQCISCGNCSTYCEMGIDVRAYAQKGEDIVRSSCVGCGICSAVCPRGVLKLENGKVEL
jgi:polyferredoxin